MWLQTKNGLMESLWAVLAAAELSMESNCCLFSQYRKKSFDKMINVGFCFHCFLCFYLIRPSGQKAKYTALNARAVLEHLTLFMEYSVTVGSLSFPLSGFRNVELITSFQKAN